MNESTNAMWYYAEDGQQRGPVGQAEFLDLVRQGTIRPETMVWRSGMAGWQAYETVADGTVRQGTAEAPCHYCGKILPVQDLIDFNGTRVCAACKPLFVQQFKENAETAAPLARRYAGFWIRFVAYFVDGIISSTITYALIIPMTLALGHDTNPVHVLASTGLNMLLSYSIALAYTAIPLVKYGATPGKMICGLKVIRTDGSPITYGRAVGRWFGEMLSSLIFCVGFLMVAFDKREHKALHDIICDTRVIYKNR